MSCLKGFENGEICLKISTLSLSLSLTFQLIQKIFKNVLGRKNSETPCGDDLIDDCRVLSLFVERKWVLLCV